MPKIEFLAQKASHYTKLSAGLEQLVSKQRDTYDPFRSIGSVLSNPIIESILLEETFDTSLFPNFRHVPP